MSEEEKKEKNTGEMSRRQFLKDAGLVIGGATVGSMAFMNACGGGTTTSTVTKTATTTVTSPPITVTSPPITTTVTVAAAGTVTLNVNGDTYVVDTEAYWPLSYVLRHVMGLTGTKVGCDRGECGTCTVIIDGKAVLACCIPVAEAQGMAITTIEGLAKGATLHKVQQTFLDMQTFQCGYCTPGNIMSAVALLTEIPKPTLAQAQEGMSGNLCFCGDYTRILNAVMKAAA